MIHHSTQLHSPVKDVSGHHCVHSTEGIIEEVHLSLVVHCSGQVYPGLLAPAQGHAPLPHEGVVSIRKLLYVLGGGETWGEGSQLRTKGQEGGRLQGQKGGRSQYPRSGQSKVMQVKGQPIYMYLDQCTGVYHRIVPLLVERVSKEDVLPQ